MEESGLSMTIGGLIAALKRRIGLIIAIAIAGGVTGLAVAYFLPPVFRSSATILVESQQIPTDLARSTITATASERLKLIEQRLMTRNNLVDIMDKFSLYQDQDEKTLSELIQQMRSSTQIKPVAVKGRGRNASEVAAFVISFDDDSARIASLVANEFVTRILDQNVTSRRSRATETHSFFRDEVERIRRELLSVEAEISRFKTDNSDALPDSLAQRRGLVDELNHRQFLLQQQVVELKERERQITAALNDRTGTLFSRQTSPAEVDLQTLRREFAQKRAIYSSQHPEIKQLQARIRSLEATIARDLANSQPQPEAGEDGGETSTVAARARMEMESISVQIANLEQQVAEIEMQRDNVRESIGRTPGVETELNNLNRRYQELELQYSTAVRKQSEAATGEKLEVSRQAEQFEVIEQAQIPEEPIAPNRPLIAAGGAVGSIAFAFGIALLLELTSKTIHSREDLARLAKIRPIATVPVIRVEGEKRMAWSSDKKPKPPKRPTA